VADALAEGDYMPDATPQLVNVYVIGSGLYWAIASYGVILLVLVVGGIWGFRLGDGGGRGGGSGRARRPDPTPPSGGRELPGDFAAWESQLAAAGGKAAVGAGGDTGPGEDRPLEVG
jgi:hypothetical protein